MPTAAASRGKRKRTDVSREKNRLHAKLSRFRKKVELEVTESAVLRLQAENETIRNLLTSIHGLLQGATAEAGLTSAASRSFRTSILKSPMLAGSISGLSANLLGIPKGDVPGIVDVYADAPSTRRGRQPPGAIASGSAAMDSGTGSTLSSGQSWFSVDSENPLHSRQPLLNSQVEPGGRRERQASMPPPPNPHVPGADSNLTSSQYGNQSMSNSWLSHSGTSSGMSVGASTMLSHAQSGQRPQRRSVPSSGSARDKYSSHFNPQAEHGFPYYGMGGNPGFNLDFAPPGLQPGSEAPGLRATRTQPQALPQGIQHPQGYYQGYQHQYQQQQQYPLHGSGRMSEAFYQPQHGWRPHTRAPDGTAPSTEMPGRVAPPYQQQQQQQAPAAQPQGREAGSLSALLQEGLSEPTSASQAEGGGGNHGSNGSNGSGGSRSGSGKSNRTASDQNDSPPDLTEAATGLERQSVLASVRDSSATVLVAADYELMRRVDTGRQPFVLTDPGQPDNPCIFATADFLDIVGYTSDELTGKNLRFLQGPATNSNTAKKIGEAVREGKSVHAVLVNYRKNGMPFWNSLFIAPLRNPDLRIINFVGVMTEVSPSHAKEMLARNVPALPLSSAAASSMPVSAASSVPSLTGPRVDYQPPSHSSWAPHMAPPRSVAPASHEMGSPVISISGSTRGGSGPLGFHAIASDSFQDQMGMRFDELYNQGFTPPPSAGFSLGGFRSSAGPISDYAAMHKPPSLMGRNRSSAPSFDIQGSIDMNEDRPEDILAP